MFNRRASNRRVFNRRSFNRRAFNRRAFNYRRAFNRRVFKGYFASESDTQLYFVIEWDVNQSFILV